MTGDVFISYCRENREAARILADTIAAQGYSVWWDHDLVAGDSYTEVIEQRLDSAEAVVVIWSEFSRKSHWVRDEAAVGRDRNRLLPVAIDGNLPPLGFRQIQTIDLQGWDGQDPSRIAPLFQGIANLTKGVDAAQRRSDAGGAAASNPFGAPSSSMKEGLVVAGVTAAPNNKPVKQILKEEKKQRGFFRTYFLTSFLLSALLAGGLGAAYVQSEGLSEAGAGEEALAVRIGELIGAFLLVGIGLFLGRFLIIIGRRLSKRKSIRYFDSVTITAMAIAVLVGVFTGYLNTLAVIEGEAPMSLLDSLVLGSLASIGFFFPIVSLFSVPIGFFRGLGRTSFADGK